MKVTVFLLTSLAIGLSWGGSAFAQSAPQPVPQGVQAAPPPGEAAPPAAQWTYSYPTGQWVYTSDNGWVWVPADAAPTVVEGVPYAYLYTPAYGWTWYVSPWGWGPYRYGAWVRHPWRPYGWRGGWVAHPHVVVRLGVGWHGGYYHPVHVAPHYGAITGPLRGPQRRPLRRRRASSMTPR